LDTKINTWKYKLLKIYDYVCNKHDETLKYHYQRFSNNNIPGFTDQEILTIYLFATHHRNLFKIKDIYNYAEDHLISWFPSLNSYQAFNNRLNRICGAMNILVESLLQEFRPNDCCNNHSLLDSMPNLFR